MKLLKHCSVFIDEIDIGERLRAVDPEYAALLAATIRQQGLQHPIEVMGQGNRFRLISGAHRLAAYKLLKRETIEARIVEPETEKPALEIQFDEIIENVGRHELNALDRAAHLSQLEAIWLELYPNRGHGGDRRSAKLKSSEQTLPSWSRPDTQVFSLSEAVKSKTGFSRRTFSAALEMWNGLSDESKAAVRGTKFVDNHVQLAELAKETPEDQHAILKLLGLVERQEGAKPRASTVRQAWEIHHNKVDPRDPTEKGFDHIREVFRKSSEEVRKQFILWLALKHQRFVAPGTKYLGDRGRAKAFAKREKEGQS